MVIALLCFKVKVTSLLGQLGSCRTNGFVCAKSEDEWQPCCAGPGHLLPVERNMNGAFLAVEAHKEKATSLLVKPSLSVRLGKGRDESLLSRAGCQLSREKADGCTQGGEKDRRGEDGAWVAETEVSFSMGRDLGGPSAPHIPGAAGA